MRMEIGDYALGKDMSCCFVLCCAKDGGGGWGMVPPNSVCMSGVGWLVGGQVCCEYACRYACYACLYYVRVCVCVGASRCKMRKKRGYFVVRREKVH